MSSASSFQPTPYLNLYSSSKVFVRYYSRALNQELKRTGISVTAVCPVYSKFLHVYGKVMPQKLIMWQWKYWIKDYI